MGVWSSADHLNLYLDDTLSQTNHQLNYTCTTYTEMLCNNTRPGNRVDCLVHYEYVIQHNTSYLLINISSLTKQED